MTRQKFKRWYATEKEVFERGGVIVEDKKLPSMRITVCAVHIVEQLVS